jgi:hypothetical protein
MITLRFIAAIAALSLMLQGCLFDESGTEYIEPSTHTDPKVNLNYDTSVPLATYLTFAEDSADITVTFGSQKFSFPNRSEMYLKGYGGFDTDRVWKTSILEDSRGIKTLRMGYYIVSSSDNEIGPPAFHNFAKDERGNIYLTETSEQLRSDLGVAPFRQTSPALLFPAKVEVGESWVAGPTIVPLFYNFSSGTGWTATLVDDNATAPVSGIENCIVIKYYGESYSYYMYLKDGLGVVEWINSWSDENGKVKPDNGWARAQGGTGTTDIDYTGFGWGHTVGNPVGSVFSSLGIKVVEGEEANIKAGESSPVNDSGYNFYRVAETSPSDSANYPTLTELLLPYEREFDSIDFSESKWDALAGKFYHPSIKLKFDSKTYVADESKGTFTVDKLFDEPFGPQRQEFIGRGTLVNEADLSDSREFVTLLSGNYFNAEKDGFTQDFAVFGLDKNQRLKAAAPGSTYRIYFSYAAINEPLKAAMALINGDEFNITDLSYVYHCFGSRDADGLCISVHAAIQFTVPDVEGELRLRVGGLDATGNTKAVSQDFYLPVTRTISNKGAPTARFYDKFDDIIQGSLDADGKFETGYINSLASTDRGFGTIVKYAYDFGDGTIHSDAPPLGTYTYTQNGEYQIKLTVTDNDGNTADAYRKVVITDNGNIVVRNIGSEYNSQFFTVAIDNLDKPDGYYDTYQYVFLAQGESKVFTVPGNFNYEVDIFKDGERVRENEIYIRPADNEVIEVNLD